MYFFESLASVISSSSSSPTFLSALFAGISAICAVLSSMKLLYDRPVLTVTQYTEHKAKNVSQYCDSGGFKLHIESDLENEIGAIENSYGVPNYWLRLFVRVDNKGFKDAAIDNFTLKLDTKSKLNKIFYSSQIYKISIENAKEIAYNYKCSPYYDKISAKMWDGKYDTIVKSNSYEYFFVYITVSDLLSTMDTEGDPRFKNERPEVKKALIYNTRMNSYSTNLSGILRVNPVSVKLFGLDYLLEKIFKSYNSSCLVELTRAHLNRDGTKELCEREEIFKSIDDRKEKLNEDNPSHKGRP